MVVGVGSGIIAALGRVVGGVSEIMVGCGWQRQNYGWSWVVVGVCGWSHNLVVVGGRGWSHDLVIPIIFK